MKKIGIVVAIILALAMVGAAYAQVTYNKSVYTSYQVVNLGTGNANVTVTYYGQDGTPQAYQKQFQLGIGGSLAVQQSLENSLTCSKCSAVILADQPIAAIANQQLGDAGSGSSYPPFSSYDAASSGSTSVTVPAVMYNWYGYYTELFIQNVGDVPAKNITITYNPTSLSGTGGATCTTGATGQTDVVADNANQLAQYASKTMSQFAVSKLGAPVTANCTSYNGRFLGGATITADQPIVVVANEVVQDKLFTYNGFTAAGTDVLGPAYMKNWFGYYTSITIANPGATAANLTITYTPAAGSNPSAVITSNTRSVPAGKSITLYEGNTTNASQSDLVASYPNNSPSTIRFFGTIKIHSTQPIMAVVNQEAVASSGNQAGSYNTMLTTEGTAKINAPFIVSNYYNFYSSLTIMTVTGAEANLRLTYTSDGVFSSVKNGTKAYTMNTTNGLLNRYEGATCAGPAACDLLKDAFWAGGDASHRFIGSVTIDVLSGPNIVAFVNAEMAKGSTPPVRDTMYTYNAFNVAP